MRKTFRVVCGLWLAVASMGLMMGAGHAQNSDHSASRPNVLFLFADDLSAEMIGAAGEFGVKTPNLDRLIQNGTSFSRAYNMGSWSPAICVASRTMMMTGRTVWRAQPGKLNLRQEVQNGRMWPQRMKQAGYVTWMTGKWHVAVKPENVFSVVKNVRGGMPKDETITYHRPKPDGSDPWSPSDPAFGGYWSGGKHWTEVTADDAIEFLELAKTEPKPFFLYVAFNAPHDPRQSPQEYLDQYPLENVSVPSSWLPEYPYAEAMGAGRNLRDEKLASFPRTEHAIKVHRREYAAIITHLDAHIGRVLDALEKSGKADNTVVFFAADNGLSVGHHGLFGKQNPYEVSIKVPLVMYGKGVPAGKVVSQPVWLQDIMATTLELAGLGKPAEVEFHSLWSLLKDSESDGSKPEKDRPVYFAYLDKQRAVTAEGYKLILYPAAAKARLYHLASDQEEKVDLSARQELLPMMKRLFAELLDLQTKYEDTLDLARIFPRLLEGVTGKSKPVADTSNTKAKSSVDSDKAFMRKPNPAMQPISDEPGLPRVLLIGDSISIGYTLPVRQLLKGKANVHRIPVNGGPTRNGIANIDKWLGNGRWDVIHFNWGLHDLKHMPPDGKRQVETEDYEKNLLQLVERMQQTGAKLIWATTTPVPDGPLNPPRTFGDVAIYNDLAAKVMKEKGVGINDLNAWITPKLDELQKKRDVHFTDEGSKYLAKKVAQEIEKLLPQATPTKKE